MAAQLPFRGTEVEAWAQMRVRPRSCGMTIAQTVEQTEQALLEFDRQAQKTFKPFKSSPPVRALDLLSKLGDQPELRVIAGAMFLAGLLSANQRLTRAALRTIIAHETATALKNLIKVNVDRTRPRSADTHRERKVKKGKHTSKDKTSFPSGHSAGSIAAARAFSREYPEYRAVVLGGAGLIAASQVPRCAHYPTDVAAGLAIGLAVEALVGRSLNAV